MTDQTAVGGLEEENRQLRQALANRPRTEHAVGIVMVLLGCDEAAAFRALSRLSQHVNVKVRVLADLLVEQVASGEEADEDLVTVLRLVVDGRP